ncbi:MAG: putative tricarboxylic transport membrane protein [Paracoccaceae bacterium]|jgi:putative tricarboxylic transport membrane protein
MKVNDAVSGAALIAFAAAVAWQTLSFPPMPGQRFSSALFPQIVATLMALSGCILIVKGVMARAEAPIVAIPDWMRSPRRLVNFAVLIGSLAFYLLFSNALGFIPTATLVLVAVMTSLRGVGRIGSSVLIALIASFGMQQFFGGLLRVPLPYGIIPPTLF